MHTVALDRPAMTGLGICALDQSRILGNVHALLSTDTVRDQSLPSLQFPCGLWWVN